MSYSYSRVTAELRWVQGIEIESQQSLIYKSSVQVWKSWKHIQQQIKRRRMFSYQNFTPDAQSTFYRTELASQLNQIPSIQTQFYGPIIAQLLFKFQFLSTELQKMKTEVATLKENLEVAKGEMIDLGVDSSQSRGGAGRGKRKCFPKHLTCCFRGCGSRYSSRIALRAHMRKIHQQGESPIG